MLLLLIPLSVVNHSGQVVHTQHNSVLAKWWWWNAAGSQLQASWKVPTAYHRVYNWVVCTCISRNWDQQQLQHSHWVWNHLYLT